MNEFSRFYNQVEDIYYMFADLDRFEDPNISTQTKQLITKAFDKPWKGGGSYLSFYDNIANDNLPTAPLKVSGIQYHSPGYVAIKAKKEHSTPTSSTSEPIGTTVLSASRSAIELGKYSLIATSSPK